MAAYRNEATTERFEKRKIPRFAVQLPVMLGYDEDLSSICTNLSSEGVSVETAKNLHVGDRIFVQVTLTANQNPLKLQGKVVWRKNTQALDPKSRPLFEIGIRFIRPLPSPWKTPGRFEFSEGPFGFEPEFEEDFPDFIPYKRI